MALLRRSYSRFFRRTYSTVAAALLLAGGPLAAAERVTVFAAASTGAALEDVAQLYEQGRLPCRQRACIR